MICRFSACEHRSFSGLLSQLVLHASTATRQWHTERACYFLLAGLLFHAAATTAIGQPTTNGPTPAIAARAGAPQGPSAQVVAARPPIVVQSPLRPLPGAAPYFAQPSFAVPPPGYRPLAPPPPFNGLPPFLRGWRRPGRFTQIPPAPYPAIPVQPLPSRPNLPEMVYMVTAKTWFRADALVWWTKSAPVPQPIVTTGSTADTVPGAAGQPGTQVPFGANNYGFGYVGGIRLETGIWFDPGRVMGVEAGYFVLIEQERDFTDQSDIMGNPLIARPTINASSGKESAYYDSLPGQVVGGVAVKMRSEFQGANCDGALNLVQTQSLRVDGLLGFRYLSLAESLNVTDQFVDVMGATRSFAGAPINYNDALTDFDGFRTTNSFYGGSGGARLYYAQGRWYITALGKVALGPVQERAVISGSTSLTDQTGHTTTVPGGVMATAANMGRYYQSVFAVAPEGRLNFGYQITPLITMRVGYTFIYLSNVARPGSQVTRVTNPSQVPSDRSYSPSATSVAAFQFHSSSYWAQGLNFGLDFRF